MKSCAVVTLAAVVLLAGSKALAQDEVKYLDRATQKEASAKGTIQEEKPGHIVVKTSTGGTKEIPAVDVLDVVYLTPAAIRLEYRNAELKITSSNNPQSTADARKKAAADALAAFKK